MTQDPKLRADRSKIVMDLCFRIERMCRYSPLDNGEVKGKTMSDRRIVEGFYYFYKNKNYNKEAASRQARANAVRIILNEILL